VALARVTEIDATGAGGGDVTTTAMLALTPSTCAEIVAPPAATAVTRPVDDTVATVAEELDQFTTRSASNAPAVSRTVAVSCVVLPTTSAAVIGETLTEAAGTAVTEIGADVVRPSADALTAVVPTVSPVNTPTEVTAAIVAPALDHVTT
jgi:hypothetical protein